MHKIRTSPDSNPAAFWEVLGRAPCCFAAGTLIHGRDGLVPIEAMQAGDWVLTQPQATGERTFKRVTKATRFDDRALFRVCYSIDGDTDSPLYVLAVTAEHPLFVKGHDPEELRATSGRPRATGWIAAEDLLYGSLLDLADGRTGWVQSVDPIWRTSLSGIGFISKRDREHGQMVDLRGGKIARLGGFREVSEYLGVDDFNLRYESTWCTDKWAYNAPVYKLEVEDCHTYYAGEAGAWVAEQAGANMTSKP